MVNLTDYLRDIGVELPSGYTLALPLAISDDGTTIAGLGRQGFAASGFIVRIKALTADVNTLSLAAGGSQTLSLDAGIDNANAFYWMFGSVTGTSPGFFVGSVYVPLNIDAYTLLTIKKPFLGVFNSFVGFFDAQGEGQASFDLPTGADPDLAGVTLYHAYLAGPALGQTTYASSAVSVTLMM